MTIDTFTRDPFECKLYQDLLIECIQQRYTKIMSIHATATTTLIDNWSSQCQILTPLKQVLDADTFSIVSVYPFLTYLDTRNREILASSLSFPQGCLPIIQLHSFTMYDMIILLFSYDIHLVADVISWDYDIHTYFNSDQLSSRRPTTFQRKNVNTLSKTSTVWAKLWSLNNLSLKHITASLLDVTSNFFQDLSIAMTHKSHQFNSYHISWADDIPAQYTLILYTLGIVFSSLYMYHQETFKVGTHLNTRKLNPSLNTEVLKNLLSREMEVKLKVYKINKEIQDLSIQMQQYESDMNSHSSISYDQWKHDINKLQENKIQVLEEMIEISQDITTEILRITQDTCTRIDTLFCSVYDHIQRVIAILSNTHTLDNIISDYEGSLEEYSHACISNYERLTVSPNWRTEARSLEKRIQQIDINSCFQELLSFQSSLSQLSEEDTYYINTNKLVNIGLVMLKQVYTVTLNFPKYIRVFDKSESLVSEISSKSNEFSSRITQLTEQILDCTKNIVKVTDTYDRDDIKNIGINAVILIDDITYYMNSSTVKAYPMMTSSYQSTISYIADMLSIFIHVIKQLKKDLFDGGFSVIADKVIPIKSSLYTLTESDDIGLFFNRLNYELDSIVYSMKQIIPRIVFNMMTSSRELLLDINTCRNSDISNKLTLSYILYGLSKYCIPCLLGIEIGDIYTCTLDHLQCQEVMKLYEDKQLSHLHILIQKLSDLSKTPTGMNLSRKDIDILRNECINIIQCSMVLHPIAINYLNDIVKIIDTLLGEQISVLITTTDHQITQYHNTVKNLRFSELICPQYDSNHTLTGLELNTNNISLANFIHPDTMVIIHEKFNEILSTYSKSHTMQDQENHTANQLLLDVERINQLTDLYRLSYLMKGRQLLQIIQCAPLFGCSLLLDDFTTMSNTYITSMILPITELNRSYNIDNCQMILNKEIDQAITYQENTVMPKLHQFIQIDIDKATRKLENLLSDTTDTLTKIKSSYERIISDLDTCVHCRDAVRRQMGENEYESKRQREYELQRQDDLRLRSYHQAVKTVKETYELMFKALLFSAKEFYDREKYLSRDYEECIHKIQEIYNKYSYLQLKSIQQYLDIDEDKLQVIFQCKEDSWGRTYLTGKKILTCDIYINNETMPVMKCSHLHPNQEAFLYKDLIHKRILFDFGEEWGIHEYKTYRLNYNNPPMCHTIKPSKSYGGIFKLYVDLIKTMKIILCDYSYEYNQGLCEILSPHTILMALRTLDVQIASTGIKPTPQNRIHDLQTSFNEYLFGYENGLNNDKIALNNSSLYKIYLNSQDSLKQGQLLITEMNTYLMKSTTSSSSTTSMKMLFDDYMNTTWLNQIMNKVDKILKEAEVFTDRRCTSTHTINKFTIDTIRLSNYVDPSRYPIGTIWSDNITLEVNNICDLIKVNDVKKSCTYINVIYLYILTLRFCQDVLKLKTKDSLNEYNLQFIKFNTYFNSFIKESHTQMYFEMKSSLYQIATIRYTIHGILKLKFENIHEMTSSNQFIMPLTPSHVSSDVAVENSFKSLNLYTRDIYCTITSEGFFKSSVLNIEFGDILINDKLVSNRRIIVSNESVCDAYIMIDTTTLKDTAIDISIKKLTIPPRSTRLLDVSMGHMCTGTTNTRVQVIFIMKVKTDMSTQSNLSTCDVLLCATMHPVAFTVSIPDSESPNILDFSTVYVGSNVMTRDIMIQNDTNCAMTITTHCDTKRNNDEKSMIMNTSICSSFIVDPMKCILNPKCSVIIKVSLNTMSVTIAEDIQIPLIIKSLSGGIPKYISMKASIILPKLSLTCMPINSIDQESDSIQTTYVLVSDRIDTFKMEGFEPHSDGSKARMTLKNDSSIPITLSVLISGSTMTINDANVPLTLTIKSGEHTDFMVTVRSSKEGIFRGTLLIKCNTLTYTTIIEAECGYPRLDIRKTISSKLIMGDSSTPMMMAALLEPMVGDDKNLYKIKLQNKSVTIYNVGVIKAVLDLPQNSTDVLSFDQSNIVIKPRSYITVNVKFQPKSLNNDEGTLDLFYSPTYHKNTTQKAITIRWSMISNLPSIDVERTFIPLLGTRGDDPSEENFKIHQLKTNSTITQMLTVPFYIDYKSILSDGVSKIILSQRKDILVADQEFDIEMIKKSDTIKPYLLKSSETIKIDLERGPTQKFTERYIHTIHVWVTDMFVPHSPGIYARHVCFPVYLLINPYTLNVQLKSLLRLKSELISNEKHLNISSLGPLLDTIDLEDPFSVGLIPLLGSVKHNINIDITRYNQAVSAIKKIWNEVNVNYTSDMDMNTFLESLSIHINEFISSLSLSSSSSLDSKDSISKINDIIQYMIPQIRYADTPHWHYQVLCQFLSFLLPRNKSKTPDYFRWNRHLNTQIHIFFSQVTIYEKLNVLASSTLLEYEKSTERRDLLSNTLKLLSISSTAVTMTISKKLQIISDIIQKYIDLNAIDWRKDIPPLMSYLYQSISNVYILFDARFSHSDHQLSKLSFSKYQELFGNMFLYDCSVLRLSAVYDFLIRITPAPISTYLQLFNTSDMKCNCINGKNEIILRESICAAILNNAPADVSAHIQPVLRLLHILSNEDRDTKKCIDIISVYSTLIPLNSMNRLLDHIKQLYDLSISSHNLIEKIKCLLQIIRVCTRLLYQVYQLKLDNLSSDDLISKSLKAILRYLNNIFLFYSISTIHKMRMILYREMNIQVSSDDSTRLNKILEKIEHHAQRCFYLESSIDYMDIFQLSMTLVIFNIYGISSKYQNQLIKIMMTHMSILFEVVHNSGKTSPKSCLESVHTLCLLLAKKDYSTHGLAYTMSHLYSYADSHSLVDSLSAIHVVIQPMNRILSNALRTIIQHLNDTNVTKSNNDTNQITQLLDCLKVLECMDPVKLDCLDFIQHMFTAESKLELLETLLQVPSFYSDLTKVMKPILRIYQEVMLYNETNSHLDADYIKKVLFSSFPEVDMATSPYVEVWSVIIAAERCLQLHQDHIAFPLCISIISNLLVEKNFPYYWLSEDDYTSRLSQCHLSDHQPLEYRYKRRESNFYNNISREWLTSISYQDIYAIDNVVTDNNRADVIFSINIKIKANKLNHFKMIRDSESQLIRKAYVEPDDFTHIDDIQLDMDMDMDMDTNEELLSTSNNNIKASDDSVIQILETSISHIRDTLKLPTAHQSTTYTLTLDTLYAAPSDIVEVLPTFSTTCKEWIDVFYNTAVNIQSNGSYSNPVHVIYAGVSLLRLAYVMCDRLKVFGENSLIDKEIKTSSEPIRRALLLLNGSVEYLGVELQKLLKSVHALGSDTMTDHSTSILTSTQIDESTTPHNESWNMEEDPFIHLRSRAYNLIQRKAKQKQATVTNWSDMDTAAEEVLKNISMTSSHMLFDNIKTDMISNEVMELGDISTEKLFDMSLPSLSIQEDGISTNNFIDTNILHNFSCTPKLSSLKPSYNNSGIKSTQHPVLTSRSTTTTMSRGGPPPTDHSQQKAVLAMDMAPSAEKMEQLLKNMNLSQHMDMYKYGQGSNRHPNHSVTVAGKEQAKGKSTDWAYSQLIDCKPIQNFIDQVLSGEVLDLRQTVDEAHMNNPHSSGIQMEWLLLIDNSGSMSIFKTAIQEMLVVILQVLQKLEISVAVARFGDNSSSGQVVLKTFDEPMSYSVGQRILESIYFQAESSQIVCGIEKICDKVFSKRLYIEGKTNRSVLVVTDALSKELMKDVEDGIERVKKCSQDLKFSLGILQIINEQHEVMSVLENVLRQITDNTSESLMAESVQSTLVTKVTLLMSKLLHKSLKRSSSRLSKATVVDSISLMSKWLKVPSIHTQATMRHMVWPIKERIGTISKKVDMEMKSRDIVPSYKYRVSNTMSVVPHIKELQEYIHVQQGKKGTKISHTSTSNNNDTIDYENLNDSLMNYYNRIKSDHSIYPLAVQAEIEWKSVQQSISSIITDLVSVFEDLFLPTNIYTRKIGNKIGSQLYLPGVIKAFSTDFQNVDKLFAIKAAGGKRKFALSIILDISISMDGHLHECAVESLFLLISTLNTMDIDTFNVILYGSEVTTVKTESQPWDATAIFALLNNINTSRSGINVDVSTNTISSNTGSRDADALEVALTLLTNHSSIRGDQNKKIIILTDGFSSCGLRLSQILQQADERNIKVIAVSVGLERSFVSKSYQHWITAVVPTILPDAFRALLTGQMSTSSEEVDEDLSLLRQFKLDISNCAESSQDAINDLKTKRYFKKLSTDMKSARSATIVQGNGPSRQTIDIAFVLDITGSMEPWLNAAEAQMEAIVKGIPEAVAKAHPQLSTYFRFAVVPYRDINDRAIPSHQFAPFPMIPEDIESMASSKRTTIDKVLDSIYTTSQKQAMSALQGYLNNLTTDGGDDIPEDVLGALQHTCDLNWESRIRFVILITDAPGHGNLLNDFPKVSQSGAQHPHVDNLPNTDINTWKKTMKKLSMDIKAGLYVCHVTAQSTQKMFKFIQKIHKELGEFDYQEKTIPRDIKLFSDTCPPTRSKLHIVFVLDESSSMRGRPWRELAVAYDNFISTRLRGSQGLCGDYISTIKFDRYVRHQHSSFFQLTTSSQPRLETYEGSGTKFAPALKEAYITMERHDNPSITPMLIFMSDGDDCGKEDPVSVMSKIYIRFHMRGLQVHTISFGSDTSGVQLLQSMANASGGRFHRLATGVDLNTGFTKIAAEAGAADGLIQSFSQIIADNVADRIVIDYL